MILALAPACWISASLMLRSTARLKAWRLNSNSPENNCVRICSIVFIWLQNLAVLPYEISDAFQCLFYFFVGRGIGAADITRAADAKGPTWNDRDPFLVE